MFSSRDGRQLSANSSGSDRFSGDSIGSGIGDSSHHKGRNNNAGGNANSNDGSMRSQRQQDEPKPRISLDKFRLNAPEVDDDDESEFEHGNDSSSRIDHSTNARKFNSSSMSVPRSSFQWIGDDLEDPSRGFHGNDKIKNPSQPTAPPSSNSNSNSNSKPPTPKSSLRKTAFGAPASPTSAKTQYSSNGVHFGANQNEIGNTSANGSKASATVGHNSQSSMYHTKVDTMPSSNQQQIMESASEERLQIQQQLESSEQIVAMARQRTQLRRCIVTVLIVCLIIFFALLVAAIISVTGGDDSSDSNDSGNNNNNTMSAMPTASPTAAPTVEANVGLLRSPTVRAINERGKLRCGIGLSFGFAEYNETTDHYVGIDVDLCHAMASGMFGSFEDRVEYVKISPFNRFQTLRDEEIDILFAKTTATMQRNIREAVSGAMLTFTVPYLYNYLLFAGLPEFVQCAETLAVGSRNITNEGDIVSLPPTCDGMRICVLQGTTHDDALKAIVPPGVQLIPVAIQAQLYSNFQDETCNIIVGDQYDIAQPILQRQGYDGPYGVTNTSIAEETISMTTLSNDAVFSDYANWVVEALFTAEEAGFTAGDAVRMGKTQIYGPDYEDAFINIIQSVGNYAEVFERHLESLSPRSTVNRLNAGDTGLMYPFPFGDLSTAGVEPNSTHTLRIVQERGFLRCGVARRPFFANLDAGIGAWSGFDVDFCRAVAAAIFKGDSGRVEFTDLTTTDRFVALRDGEVDVLARLTTHTLERDVREPTSKVGFAFSAPTFHDGLQFGGIPAFVQCADNEDITSISCRSLKACVIQDTTFEAALAEIFMADLVVSRDSIQSIAQALNDGTCNVVAGGVLDVYEPTIRENGYSGAYRAGIKRFSREPLALVTREDDALWSRFVFWVVIGTFFAENEGITSQTFSRMPAVNLFGPDFTTMLKDSTMAVGSYAQIFQRNGGDVLPQDGQNALNQFLTSPQISSLPGII